MMKDPHLQIEVGYVELQVNIIDGSYQGELGYIHRVVNLHYQHVEILNKDKMSTGKVVHVSNNFLRVA